MYACVIPEHITLAVLLHLRKVFKDKGILL